LSKNIENIIFKKYSLSIKAVLIKDEERNSNE